MSLIPKHDQIYTYIRFAGRKLVMLKVQENQWATQMALRNELDFRMALRNELGFQMVRKNLKATQRVPQSSLDNS